MKFKDLGIDIPKFSGSNNFAISGKHTKSGKPMIENDPHLPNKVPSIWYQSAIYIGE